MLAVRLVDSPSLHSHPAFGLRPESKTVHGLQRVPTGQVALVVILQEELEQADGLQLLPIAHLLGSVLAQADTDTDGFEV